MYTDMLRSLLTIKGAPDVLMPRLSNYVSPSGYTTALDPATRASIEQIKDEWSSQGRRVLLLARKAISKSALRGNPSDSSYEMEVNNQAKSGLTLVGMVGIVDPPRPEIPEVMNTLRGAGIRIFMVCKPLYTTQVLGPESSALTHFSGHR